MPFVLDCSVAISWLLRDESSDYADRVLVSLTRPEMWAIVPPSFWIELANVLWVAERRGRLATGEAEEALAIALVWPVQVDLALLDRGLPLALSLARQYGLAVYDAAYLAIAVKDQVRLATLDNRLAGAAADLGLLFED